MPATISSTTEGNWRRGKKPSRSGAPNATAEMMSRLVKEGMLLGPGRGPAVTATVTPRELRGQGPHDLRDPHSPARLGRGRPERPHRRLRHARRLRVGRAPEPGRLDRLALPPTLRLARD